jgi:ectoine hydroxylase-related dioxygenase (phytanoyl-CoA dioxygenase family)
MSSGLELRAQLERDGFCVLPSVFDRPLVAEMNEAATALAAAQSEDAAERQQYTGSLISLTSNSVYAEMLTSDAVREGFISMGTPYADARFMNGYIISKPGRGRRLYWHQDWWGWDKLESYGTIPPMYALMTYLKATRAPTASDPGNGCLRVIPGTHRKRHFLHNRVPDAHGDEISFSKMEGPAFDTDVEGAVDVPMEAGDAVLVDVRLLHATRDNNTDERRSMITCWWVPQPQEGGDYRIPPEWSAEFAAQTTDNPHDQAESQWTTEEAKRVQQLYCTYSGGLGRYHGGPPGQPHQPGAGPGFELLQEDSTTNNPPLNYFGSGRAEVVQVQQEGE